MRVSIEALASAGDLLVARGVPRQRTDSESDSDLDVAVVTPTELLSGATFDRRTSREDATDSGALFCEPGDVLVTLDGGRIGVPYFVRRPFDLPVVPSQGAATLRVASGGPLVAGYLYAWFAGPAFQEEAARRTRGSAMQHLAWRDFMTIDIPVPSLEEQLAVSEDVERYLDVVESHRRTADVAEELLALDLELLATRLERSSLSAEAQER